MKKLLLLPLILLSLAGFSTPILAKSPSVTVQPAWHYEQIGFAGYPYQSFLKNWDDAAHPVFYALIRSAHEYDRYFAPAAVMGNKKPYKPEPGFYQTENLLVVARVTKPPVSGASDFSLLSLVQKNGVIKLCYKLRTADRKAAYTRKDGLVIRFDRVSVRKIVIYENGAKVGEIDAVHDSFPVR
ncbi:MAG: hypothetical protein HGA26_02545 [Chlorobiaceae bacterium]|nr:hypothetical protein [Chlorobiaceae bacterium]